MVNRRRNYTWHFLLMAILTAVAIGVVNYLAMEHRVRVDLTADQRFTLSEGTQRLFEKLPDNITITYYVNEEPPAKRINLERDVVDKLEELAVSSQGKLQYQVERIPRDQIATRRDELEQKGIVEIVDVDTEGAVGVNSYFSGLEIRYGTSEPQPVNGIVNLVDKNDELHEHRVDTLEFDIAYTVLTMRNTTSKPTFERLLKSFDNPLRLTYYVSEPMPGQFKEMADNVEKAIQEIIALAPSKVVYQRVELGQTLQRDHPYPFGSFAIPLNEFAQRLSPPSLIFGGVVMEPNSDEELLTAIWSFEDAATVADARKKIEDQVWERVRPRSRLGFLLPPDDPMFVDPRQQPQPGQPPQNGHTPLLRYVQSALQYETAWVDLKTEKRVPRDLACLIIPEANTLGERELYEVERYLAEGGNVVMMVQNWKANLEMAGQFTMGVPLTRATNEPHFDEWTKHIGVEFGRDLLLRENSRLTPYRLIRTPFGAQGRPLEGAVTLAPIVEPGDLVSDSVFTRGLGSLSLPLPVETKLNSDRLSELKLEPTELIRMQGGVYRFLPDAAPGGNIPLNFNLVMDNRIETNPQAKPSDTALAQRMADVPLASVLLKGQFPSYWADEKLKVPGWNDDPEENDAAPVANPRPGNLLLISSSDMLNVKYGRGYSGNDWNNVVVPKGLALYRNLAEAFIYGEDLVNLRARTGIAPRIVGPVSDQSKVMWYLACLGGVPVLLMLWGAARGYARYRDRARHDAMFAGGGE